MEEGNISTDNTQTIEKIPYISLTLVEKSNNNNNACENSEEIINNIIKDIDPKESVLMNLTFRQNASKINVKDRTGELGLMINESFSLKEGESMISIVCDICTKKLYHEMNYKSNICKKCDLIFDYCIEHPDPIICPFCSQNLI